jgi:hypothetical protein
MKIESATGKFTPSVEASSAPSQGSLVPTIAQAMKMVKDCGIEEKMALMHTTSLLIMKSQFRELLGVLETNEGRFDEEGHVDYVLGPLCLFIHYATIMFVYPLCNHYAGLYMSHCLCWNYYACLSMPHSLCWNHYARLSMTHCLCSNHYVYVDGCE